MKFFHVTITAPSPSYFMGRVYITMSVAILLWIYFDHVFASNRGAAYNLTFFLEKNYWLQMLPEKYRNRHQEKQKKKKRPYTEQDLGEIQTSDSVMNSVELEKKKVIENEEKEIYADGLRIVNISKIYRKLPFGMVSAKDVHAVKGIYLEVAKNELLCLLGHNGAGKSTLFNMMTGITMPTSG